MNLRINTDQPSKIAKRISLIFIVVALWLLLVLTGLFGQSTVFGNTAAACGAFPVNVSDEAELNEAIDCFNTKVLAGTYDINLTADIALSASSSPVENSGSGIELTIFGNDFKIDGQDIANVRPLAVYTNTTVSLHDLEITGGNVDNNATLPKDQTNGGGIANYGKLTLMNTSVISNHVENGGGGIFSAEDSVLILKDSRVNYNISKDDGGGIHNFGTLDIDGSEISYNKATNFSGGLGINAALKHVTVTNSILVGNLANDGGGIYNRRSQMIVANSVISGNIANHFGGGILNNRDTAIMTVIDTFVTGNSAQFGGGGIHNNESARLNVLNSTLSGNVTQDLGEASGGGGLLNYTNSYATLQNTTISGNTGLSGLSNRGVMTLTHVTVANNADSSGTGGFGFTNLTATVPSQVIMHNTVFAGNPTDCANFESGAIKGNVKNFIETDSSGVEKCGNASSISGDAQLNPLRGNGGLSLTHDFPITSPLVDAADTSICNAMIGERRDQRGVPRPVGAGCDIGAIEYIVGLSVDDVTLVETNSGTTNAVFTISRNDNGNSVSLVVNTADGTATADKDYQPIVDQTVSFPAGGALTQSVSVPVFGDIEFEGAETFNLLLSDSVNAVIVDDSATATIEENQTIKLNITSAAESIVEEDSGTSLYSFTFTLESDAGSTFTINYETMDGTATVADNDYEQKLGVVNFSGTAGAAGSQTIDVIVNGDTKAEGNEIFFMVVTAISDAEIGVAPLPFEAVIENDDEPSVSFTSDTYITQESSGAAVVSIELSTEFNQEITVNVATTGGTAVSNQDFTALNQTITFAPGETVKNVAIAVLQDGQIEDLESFEVALSNPTNSFLGSPTTATVNIVDNGVQVFLPLIKR